MLSPRIFQKHARLITFILLGLYFLIGYLGANHFNADRSYYFNVAIPGEENLPFWPIFIFIYGLVYVGAAALPFVCTGKREWRVVAKSLLLIMTIHFILFLVFPVKMIWRPDIQTSGLASFALNLTYSIDNPYNCFPSLHIAYPLTVAFVDRKLRLSYGLLALGIAFSVVVIKQHYIADIIGAIFTSFIVYMIAKRYWLNNG